MMFVGHRMEEIYRVADRVTRAARRQLVATSRDRRAAARPCRPADGRPVAQRHVPAPRRRCRAPSCWRSSGLVARRRLRRRLLHRAGGRDRRASAAWSAAGAPRSPACCSASTGRPPARSGWTATRCAFGLAGRRHGGTASPTCRRTGIGQSLVMDFSILANASLPVIDQATDGRADPPGAASWPWSAAISSGCGCGSAAIDQPVKTLSGGNQQKVVLSKWLATKPRLLILDEPTQGIDVQTKAEVHAIIAELARQGLAIILISSELPELIGMCDRIVVLREGRDDRRASPRPRPTQERVLYADDRCRPATRRRPADGSTAGGAPPVERTAPTAGWLRQARRAPRVRPAAAPSSAVIAAGGRRQPAHAERRQPRGPGDGRGPADDRRRRRRCW